MLRQQRLNVEQLEERAVPTVTATPSPDGVPWPDATHLTISFAPDGTQIAGIPSNLNQTLNAQEPTAVWQGQVLAAVQAWAAVANINIAVVADGGQAFGTPGLPQGDPRFGAIRIGAEPLGPESLALGTPSNPSLAGTWSGDIVLNSNYDFTQPGSGLSQVMLHELGHALGLADNNTDPNSVMYSYATTPANQLDANDIAAIQALYGPRPTTPPLPPNTIPPIQALTASSTDGGSDGSLPLLAFGNLSTPGAANYYQLFGPQSYHGPATVELLTSGISLLNPIVTLYSPTGRVLGQASITNPLGGEATVAVPWVNPGPGDYIAVTGGSNDTFGFGRYGLAVTFDNADTFSSGTINSVLQGPNETLSQGQIDQLLTNPGQGRVTWNGSGNNTPGTAFALPTVAGLSAGSFYQTLVNPAVNQGTAYASFTAPPGATNALVANAPVTLTVSLQGANLQVITPTLTLLDANQQPVPFMVITYDSGTYALQATNLTPGATYYIGISSSWANLMTIMPHAGGAGTLALSVDFRQSATQPATFTQGNLDPSATPQSGTLYVGSSSLFSFLLSPTSMTAPPGTVVQMTILDQNGNVVFQLTSAVGGPTSANVLLAPGPYTVQFQATPPNGATAGQVSFNLQGTVLSDPIGPIVTPPKIKPIYKLPYPSNLYMYPNGVVSPFSYLLIGLVH